MVNQTPDEGYLSRATIGSRRISPVPDKGIWPEPKDPLQVGAAKTPPPETHLSPRRKSNPPLSSAKEESAIYGRSA